MPKKKDILDKPSKAQRKKWGGDDKEKEEHFERDILVTEETMKNIKEEISKMKMITPSTLAQKYNVRISVIKQILKDLSNQDKIKPVISTNKLKVFAQD
ncbi:MAG TPA: hypothetical protein VMV49_09295 [Candidatus Deferrimicrobium sp.]|nr:hypothetical protein [Candidatus Deferrimicrobium sp.]